jgi:hypothetical protein
VLLMGAAHGMRPRDLPAMLPGWSSSENKRASDTLRACRKRLVQMLKAEGIDLSDWETGARLPRKD